MLPALRDLLHRSVSFREIRRRLDAGERVIRASGAGASLLSFLAADLLEEGEQAVLLLLGRPEEAELFAEEAEGLVGEDRVFLFPSWELLPYEKHSPPLEITALRQRTLGALARGEGGIVVSTPRALQTRLAPRGVLAGQIVDLLAGAEVDVEELAQRLVHIGFRRAPVAGEPGVFARRGGIVDLFPAGKSRPVRIELLGDTIESIREYDPESQRSIRTLERVRIVPQREFPLPDETVRRAQGIAPAGLESELLKRGTFFDGIERYLPLLFPGADTLFDRLPERTVVLVLEEREVLGAAAEFWKEAERFHAASADDPLLPSPDAAFLDARELEERVFSCRTIRARRGAQEADDGETVPITYLPAPPILGNLELLEKEIRRLLADSYRVFFLCDNKGQVDRMREILEPFRDRVSIGEGKLRRGFLLREERLAVLADHEVFRRIRRARRERARPAGAPIESYLALRPGDYVVHVAYGIGRYLGVERIAVDGVNRDCVFLSYAGQDRLYVPTDQMDRLQKYSGTEGGPPSIDRIGGASWARTRARAEKAIRKMAEGLLRLYAVRRARPGFAFSPDGPWQAELESSFLYEETPHQAAAVRDTKRDMEAPRPMDRLICGDVGYGKTEVAVRAAFKAVMDGKQAAILVPTTLLAQQHFRTFRDRFGGFPIRVEVLSRFQRPAQIRAVLADLAAGRVDVLIGTHRLLQKDVVFRDLGLVVIDEEQRFGVAQKEKLKKLRETVDVLATTATPIPRTLHMSLSGVRDLSIIDTPPKDRRPIVTELVEFDPEIITAAILREIDRGGQIYFVHNRVRSIHSMAAYLSRLVPEARVGIAHGQMPERALESVMLDFLDRRIEILVTTMIIESGLDIPSVNTMLVNRADQFGLAQLYQLRGRVGRSSQRAYAYLMVPRDAAVTDDARRRLEAITTFTDLGSGYRIAMKDLEIRGAGNLLGAEQHGFVASVGFEMYCKLLEEAVRELRGEEKRGPRETRVEAAIDTFLPDGYVGDPDLKVILYRRLAETRSPEEVASIREEVEDRFGRMPREARNLFDLRELKLLGEACDAESVRVEPLRVRVRFAGAEAGRIARIRSLADAFGDRVSVDAREGFAIELANDRAREGPSAARNLLLALAGHGSIDLPNP
ncbi:MAG: transcription-repair coupling factor [Candidatus Eisenbacteria bacterium]|nr:transcription-repair coupling factor [Candidatus Eisenbacteria bacterium]